MANNHKSLKIFGCRATQHLSEKICDSLDIDLGKSSCPVFADGEFEPCYEETIRGSHVFIVQSTPPPAGTSRGKNDQNNTGYPFFSIFLHMRAPISPGTGKNSRPREHESKTR